MNRNNARVKADYALHRRRQELIEHIFGTIKRSWGYTYTLLKGRKKITGEFSLIYLAYNFTRAKNILGFDKMLQAIKNWTLKYLVRLRRMVFYFSDFIASPISYTKFSVSICNYIFSIPKSQLIPSQKV